MFLTGEPAEAFKTSSLSAEQAFLRSMEWPSLYQGPREADAGEEPVTGSGCVTLAAGAE